NRDFIASLAMRGTWLRVPAAGFARVVLVNALEKIQRAQGMPDAGRTHGPPATKNAGGSYRKSSRSNRHSLRNGLRLIRGLLGVPGLLATVARKIASELDPSVGGPGHHDFARPLRASLVS